MKSKLFFVIAVTAILSLSLVPLPTCYDCTSSNVQFVSPSQGYRFNFNSPLPPQQNNCSISNWNPIPNSNNSNTGEDYYMCWIYSDNSFNGIRYNSTADPATSGILSGTPPTGTKLVFSTACNRYGDDNDKFKVFGGFPNSNNQPLLSYSTAATTQTLPSPSNFQINTSHGTDIASNCNQLLLIISIKNDSSQGPYRLDLYSKTKTNPINYTKYPATPAGSYPSGNNSYFEFADRLTTSAQSVSGSTWINSWEVLSFSGVKNVYCLLNVPNISATDENPIIDTFTARLTDLNNQSTILRTTVKKITIKAAYDPNLISVNKDTSHICGNSPEELEYTIHFQNIGTGDANTVNVNLDLDAALNSTSLKVTEVGIGSNIITALPGASLSSPSAGGNVYIFNFFNPAPPTVTSSSNNQPATVPADVSFSFSGNQFLKGCNAADIEDSKGYIKFKINTASAYSSIHNRAGIFFDRNPEIVTNLAVTTCASNMDSCATQLDQCHQQLKDCKKNCHDWMYWLGWIIAGLEFILLIFFITRKRK